ncbi:MAG: 4Fe-4S dicluster domain-containing protein [Gammaproteobacteria bacterium]|nr:4Fe-4S dicluster domain-containing protein [Gammaproteobacteria bacterium]
MLERLPRSTPEFEPIDWSKATASNILARIKEAGVVGMGGAGYPAAAKLASGRHYGTRHVIANGVECEPGVNADRSLMQQHLSHVLDGLRIVGHCLDCDQLTLAVSDRRVHQSFQDSDFSDVTCEMVSDHPANGEERTLIKTIFNESIPSSEYPSQRGFVVLNVATLFAICEAVRDGYRPTDRVVTVFDEERWVELDTPIESLAATPLLIRHGSVATGVMASKNAVVKLTTNAVAHDRTELARACIHCGWCDDVCPRYLPVEEMLRTQQSQSRQQGLDAYFDACFECGACVVVCPSTIPLLDWIRQGKRQTSVERLKQRANARFERRNARVAERRSDETRAREVRLHTPRKW